jgi:protein-disulfide isomerase
MQEVKPVSSGLDGDDEVETVEDVEKVIAKWVEANPKFIIQAFAKIEQQAREERVKMAGQNISAKKEEIFNDKNSPSYAAGSYDVTIVEFFDYSCGYCKRANATVEEVLKSDSKVRVVYKEFPILGPSSEELSSVAIAVHLSDPASYKKFHDALMKSNARSKDAALKVAKEKGLNVAKINATLSEQKDKIAQIIQENRALGGSIGIDGTPAFIIGEELVPGAMDTESFKAKIKELRNK